MQVNWMNHTGFVVSDMESALGFYRDLLGLEVQRDATAEGEAISHILGFEDARVRIVQLGTGDMRHAVELLEYLHPKPSRRLEAARNDVGAAHLALVVDDLERWYELLRGRGITFVNPPRFREAAYPRGRRTCYLQDPDGNWLEMIERDDPPADATTP